MSQFFLNLYQPRYEGRMEKNHIIDIFTVSNKNLAHFLPSMGFRNRWFHIWISGRYRLFIFSSNFIFNVNFQKKS